jgi:hypothetical protein
MICSELSARMTGIMPGSSRYARAWECAVIGK